MGAVRCAFLLQAEDGIRDSSVTGVQTCALPICLALFAPEKDGQRIRQAMQGVDRHVQAWRAATREQRQAQSLPGAPAQRAAVPRFAPGEIGRASCRERGEISVVAVSLKKKKRTA